MRILHLLTHLSGAGNGIVNATVDLAISQVLRGHEVFVASGGGAYEDLLKKHGVVAIALPQRRTPLGIVSAVVRYRKIIARVHPDIVHAHMVTGAVVARLGTPFRKMPIVATVHNEFARTAVLMGIADRVIAVSASVGDLLVKRGLPKSKVAVVRNGPLGSLRRSSPGAAEDISLQRPAIVTVAGMYRRKGIAELLDGFARIADTQPDVHLYLVGDGPDRSEFERQAASLPCSAHVHFLGFRADPAGFMRACDVFVLASRREPFGLVLAEAREAACAIVATAVDGIPEVLDFGRAGVLVPARDPGALAHAVLTLLRHKSFRDAMAAAATVDLAWLNVERVSAETFDVYALLLRREPRSHSLASA